MTIIPMDLGNWAHITRRGPRHQQLIVLALKSPGRIFAAVRYAEGPCDYANHLASLPPMPVEDLLPQLTSAWRTPDQPGYGKHGVIRAQVKDGVLRTADFRVDLTGSPSKDAREKALLLADLTPSKEWLEQEAA